MTRASCPGDTGIIPRHYDDMCFCDTNATLFFTSLFVCDATTFSDSRGTIVNQGERAISLIMIKRVAKADDL